MAILDICSCSAGRMMAMTALAAILPLCHSERCRSIRDGERGTPSMFAATMQHQGILPRIPFCVPSFPLSDGF